MAGGRTVNGVDLDELEGHLGVLEARGTALKRQLDKGVPQAEFARLHALLTAVERAASALGEIRAALEQALAQR